jgi:DNA-binding transcriptional MerR regulator
VNESPKELVTLAQMARLLGVHPTTLRNYHTAEKVRSYKLGRNILRFCPAEVYEDMMRLRASMKKPAS